MLVPTKCSPEQKLIAVQDYLSLLYFSHKPKLHVILLTASNHKSTIWNIKASNY